MLCAAFLLCLTTLTGCASGRAIYDSRFSRLEFELNRVTSRIDRLESKIDLLNWSVSPAVVNRTVAEPDLKRERLEDLVVDITTHLSRLRERLAAFEVQPQAKK